MNKKPDFTKGSISKHILYLAVPASIGMFFNTMYNVVDTYFAGKYSLDALAALSLSFPVFFLILAFSFGVGNGVSVLIANAEGEKKPDKSKIYIAQSFSFSLIISVFLTLIGILFLEDVFIFLGAEGNYLKLALQYTNVIFLGSVFFVLMFLFNSILSALGDTRSFRNTLILGFFLNIFLSPWFLFGGFGLPAFGIAGIAYATILINVISILYMLHKICKRGLLKYFQFKYLIPQKNIFREIAEQGFPASLSMLTVAVGVFVITYYVGTYSKEAVAAYGITTRIEQIALLPTVGLNTAVLTLVGQNNGAKKYERITEILSKSLKYGAFLIVIGTVFIFFGAEMLIKFFTDDLNVLEIGVENLKIVVFLAYAYVLIFIYTSALQGIKKPAFALWIGVYRQLVLPPLIFFLVAKVWQLEIVFIWWGIFLINWSAAIITIFYARSKLRRLTLKSQTS